MKIIEVLMIVILVLILGILVSIFLTGILWVIIKIAEQNQYIDFKGENNE